MDKKAFKEGRQIDLEIGKIITRTKVVICLGEKPHFFTIFVRTLCRIIPLDPLTFVAKGYGWHDNLQVFL